MVFFPSMDLFTTNIVKLRITSFTQCFNRVINSCNFSHYPSHLLSLCCCEQKKSHRIHCNLFTFLIFLFYLQLFFFFCSLFSINLFHTLLFAAAVIRIGNCTGGPLGLFIIFPEPIFGPPLAASNCDIKRRTIGRTSNANRIHVQRRSKCTILSAFCSVKNGRIVEGTNKHNLHDFMWTTSFHLVCKTKLQMIFVFFFAGKRFG